MVPNPYKSSARVLVDRSMSRYLQNNKIVDQPTFDEAEVGSQQYVMSSDSVIVPMIRSLGLTRDSEFVGQPKMGGARISDYIGDIKKAIAGLFGMRVTPVDDPEAALERTAVEAIAKRLTVTREDIANVINVAFESEDKAKAAKIANAIAESYVATTMSAKLNSTRVASQWLQDRLVELKKQAADADRALQDFKAANNLKTAAGGQEQRANLETQLANAQIAAAEAKSRLDRIRLRNGEDVTTQMNTDALNNNAKAGLTSPGELFSLTNNELIRLRAQYRDLSARAADIKFPCRPEPSHCPESSDGKPTTSRPRSRPRKSASPIPTPTNTRSPMPARPRSRRPSPIWPAAPRPAASCANSKARPKRCTSSTTAHCRNIKRSTRSKPRPCRSRVRG